MPLGTEVSLGPGDIVLDEDPASPQEGGTAPPVLADVCCAQTAAWITDYFFKMPLGMEVDLGPGDIVLGGDPAPPKKGVQHPQFWPMYCGQMAGWIKMPLVRQ